MTRESLKYTGIHPSIHDELDEIVEHVSWLRQERWTQRLALEEAIHAYWLAMQPSVDARLNGEREMTVNDNGYNETQEPRDEWYRRVTDAETELAQVKAELKLLQEWKERQAETAADLVIEDDTETVQAILKLLEIEWSPF